MSKAAKKAARKDADCCYTQTPTERERESMYANTRRQRAPTARGARRSTGEDSSLFLSFPFHFLCPLLRLGCGRRQTLDSGALSNPLTAFELTSKIHERRVRERGTEEKDYGRSDWMEKRERGSSSSGGC